jgi:hypothetical protein
MSNKEDDKATNDALDFTIEQLRTMTVKGMREIAGSLHLNKWQNKSTLFEMLKEYAADYDENMYF